MSNFSLVPSPLRNVETDNQTQSELDTSTTCATNTLPIENTGTSTLPGEKTGGCTSLSVSRHQNPVMEHGYCLTKEVHT